MFGLKENSEEESVLSDYGSETSLDASRGDQEAASEDPDDMNTDGDWKVVTARGRRQSDRSLSPVSMIKHRFVVRKDTGPSRYIETEVFVNAPADVARADVAQAVHETYSAAFFQPDLYFDHRTVRVLKYIPESREYEFIGNTKSLKH